MDLEKRVISRPLELRKKDGKTFLEGYSAVFYNAARSDETQFELWGGTFERIMPGAFDEALKRPDDVRCLFNHDASSILGRSTSGTLTLTVDAIGLRFSCELSDDEDGRSIASKVGRGDVSGCSFGFIADKVVWREEGELTYREIESVRLYDVGPVTYPAYKGTDVSLAKRSLGERRAERRLPKTLAQAELHVRLQRALMA